MKHIILCILLALFCSVAHAEIKRDGDTFKVETTKTATPDTQTKFTWETKDGTKYPVYVTKKGAFYILRVSKKSGKEYKYYLPKEVQEEMKKELHINSTTAA